MSKIQIPGITLNPSPYDTDNPNDRPAAQKTAQPTVLSPTPAAPAAAPSPISIPGITLNPPPYNPGDQKDRPGGGQPASSQPQGDSPLWTALQKPTENVSDLWDAAKLTGRGVADAGRVFANQAIVPNLGDRIMSHMPWSEGFAAEQAKTAAAKKDLGTFTGPVEWVGQNYNLAALGNKAAGGGPISQVIADSPLSQGVIAGGGTALGGETDPMKILKNAATATLESKAGKAIGSTVAAGASYLGNSAKSLVARAEAEAQSALNNGDMQGYARALQKKMQIGDLNDLQNLHYQSLIDGGADVAAKARDLANQTTGAAASAYNKIADTAKTAGPLASKAKEWAGNAATSAAGWLTGGPLAATVAGGANWAGNQANKFANTKSTIDQAFPSVVDYVKNSVDTQGVQQGFSNAAQIAGGDYNAMVDKIRTFSPRSVVGSIPGSSWFGY